MPAQTCQCERSDARTGDLIIFGRYIPQIEIENIAGHRQTHGDCWRLAFLRGRRANPG